MRKYDANVQHDTKLFDIRIIFLITALNVSTRELVSNNLHGDIELIKMLENISEQITTNNQEIKVYINNLLSFSEWEFSCNEQNLHFSCIGQ